MDQNLPCNNRPKINEEIVPRLKLLDPVGKSGIKGILTAFHNQHPLLSKYAQSGSDSSYDTNKNYTIQKSSSISYIASPHEVTITTLRHAYC